MKKLYLDSDVLLDLLLDREPFSDDIATLIEESINLLSEIDLEKPLNHLSPYSQ